MNDKELFLKSIGYSVISKTMGNNLEVECTSGHRFKRSYSMFVRGTTLCVFCENEKKQILLNGIGLKCISDNINKNLTLLCDNNHITHRPYIKWSKPLIEGCAECTRIEKTKFLNDIGYTPISSNISDGLIVKCSRGHTFNRRFKHFKQGVVSCSECDLEKKTQLYDSFGLKHNHLSPSNNIHFTCEHNHTFIRSSSNFLSGHTKCPICYPSTSSQELEIKTFLEDLQVNFIHSDWNTIAPKELDFYIPDYQLAIEYDGIYWHSELQGKGSKYHLEKTLMCKEKGINLLHIFENEWMNSTKREIWKSIIRGKLNLHTKIGARKCRLEEVSKAEAKEFLDTNHLQGTLGSSIALGLYYNDELMNLMTFGKNRMGGTTEWELLRFASKLNTSVQGGASKLFKYFVKEYSENKGIVSYSDRRYSEGNMYGKLGFEFKHFSKPNYFYFKNGSLLLESRQKYMKHKLKDILEVFDENLTEWENMKINKFDRIWDCGNGVWIYNIKDNNDSK